jgi:5-oxoprolinase (ATP-hydrolysing)
MHKHTQLQHLKDNIRPGDVLVSNHPMAGGSHLPDITVMTPVFHKDRPGHPIFFVANRGHHADIGGSTPGVCACWDMNGRGGP